MGCWAFIVMTFLVTDYSGRARYDERQRLCYRTWVFGDAREPESLRIPGELRDGPRPAMEGSDADTVEIHQWNPSLKAVPELKVKL